MAESACLRALATVLAAATLNALVACHTPGAAAGDVSVPGTQTLHPGQALRLPDGGRLTYVRVVADSRCRPDVQCIRAGDADLELRWQPRTGTALTVVLNSDPRNLQQAPNAAVFGSWRVALAALDWSRPPVATLVIGTAD